MSSLSIELQYFPNLYSFKKIINSSDIIFNAYEIYQKGSFFNRCPVAGANGRILLSVPLLEGRNQKKPLREVKIANEENWQKRHWRTILSCYNSSPWFVYFSDDMAELYLKKFDYLMEWNLACLTWLLKRMKLDVSIHVTDTPGQAGMGRQADVQLFKPMEYPQVFQEKTGFIPGLSIIDMLFCIGPGETISRLRQ